MDHYFEYASGHTARLYQKKAAVLYGADGIARMEIV